MANPVSSSGTSIAGALRGQYKADGRLTYAVHTAVSAMTSKMTFKSPLEQADFTHKTETKLLTALRQNRRADIAEALKDVPDAALEAANTTLDASEKRDADGDRLLQALSDFISESKKKNTAWLQGAHKLTDFLA